MYNYYEYCRNLAKPFYPKMYLDIKNHVELVLNEADANKLHPFPDAKNFENLVNQIFDRYKKSIYKDVINGRISSANYTNNDVISITEDIIKVLLIESILNSRREFHDYPYYF